MNRRKGNGPKKKPSDPGLNGRTMAVLLISGLLLLINSVSLIDSFRQRRASVEADEEMRTLFRTEAAVPTLTPPPVLTPEPEQIRQPTKTPVRETPTAAPTVKGTPTPTLIPRLEEQPYPGNPGRKVSSRFQSIREENRDVIGWLTIGNMIDEAVTQRDNEYYMDHNAKGEQDVSGAIFLDAIVSLKTRPYALILYGHNMRTGARFGSLRNYENPSFYRNTPFITFDTLYEEGKYVVFAVGTFSLEESAPNYLDFFSLDSRRTDERRQAIRALQNSSIYSSPVDVRLEDQLLILVTCVENDAERRIVAARRIRDDENQRELKMLTDSVKKK